MQSPPSGAKGKSKVSGRKTADAVSLESKPEGGEVSAGGGADGSTASRVTGACGWSVGVVFAYY